MNISIETRECLPISKRKKQVKKDKKYFRKKLNKLWNIKQKVKING